jgi:hypothetical protein
MVSSNWTARQVHQMAHTKAVADFAKLRPTGRKEPALQPTFAQLLHAETSTNWARAIAIG